MRGQLHVQKDRYIPYRSSSSGTSLAEPIRHTQWKNAALESVDVPVEMFMYQYLDSGHLRMKSGKTKKSKCSAPEIHVKTVYLHVPNV